MDLVVAGCAALNVFLYRVTSNPIVAAFSLAAAVFCGLIAIINALKRN